jgi:hypothetical protein
MPLGKSGQYYMNPHEMKRKGDEPGAKAVPEREPDPAAGDGNEAGDGMRHHQIDEMPEGGAHSVKTNADGTQEEMDHDSYEDACAAAAGDDHEDGEEAMDGGGPNLPSDMDDMAGMYDKANQRG